MTQQPSLPLNWEAHRRALAEAQAWVTARMQLEGNPAETLRSRELGQHLREYPELNWWQQSDVAEIRRLFDLRHALLQEMEMAAPPEVPGRILCCMHGWDTNMGEGISASDGIIDGAYLPPWDTWFAVIVLNISPMEEYMLLAWVPDPCIAQVQRAIAVAATEPIAWIEDVASGKWPQLWQDKFSDESHRKIVEAYAELHSTDRLPQI